MNQSLRVALIFFQPPWPKSPYLPALEQRESAVDFVIYQGYFIHLHGEGSAWRFMAQPSTPDFPILTRGVSREFLSKGTGCGRRSETDRWVA